MRLTIDSIISTCIAQTLGFISFVKLRLSVNELEKCAVTGFYRSVAVQPKARILDVSNLIHSGIQVATLSEKQSILN